MKITTAYSLDEDVIRAVEYRAGELRRSKSSLVNKVLADSLGLLDISAKFNAGEPAGSEDAQPASGS